MHWIALIGIAVANNLDNTGVAIAFGLARIRLSHAVNLWIAIVTAAITAAAAILGAHLTRVLPTTAAHIASGTILCLIGALMLRPSKKTESVPAPSPERLNTRTPSLLSLLADPSAADRDASHHIDFREGTVLGIALSLNNIGGGFSAGLIRINTLGIALLSGALSYGVLWFGMSAGRRLRLDGIAGYARLLAGALLLLIGIYEVS